MNENLAVFFGDFGLPVVWGSASFKGVLDMPDELAADGMVISTDYSLIVQTDDVAGMLDGASLTVDGSAYRVRSVRKVTDGRLTLLTLGRI